MKIYFTYGDDDRYPYQGGWSEISAPTENMATAFYKGYHPYFSTFGRVINCDSFYDEETFKSTSMYEENDNLGSACQESFKIVKLVTSPGNIGYWVEPKSLKVYEVVVSGLDEENRELVSLDVFKDNGNIEQIHNVNLADIFVYQSDAYDFAAQIARYK